MTSKEFVSKVKVCFISMNKDFEKAFKKLEKDLDLLEQYKAIENELGIDLIKLFTAKKVYFYDTTTDRIEETNYYIVDFMLKQIEVENNYSIPTRLDFEQYGMTWALTKEELEQ